MATNYTLNIDVKARADKLKQFQDRLDKTQERVKQTNKSLETFYGQTRRVAENIGNLNQQLNQAARTFNKSTLGTKGATDAAKDFIRATENLNKGLRERKQLLEDIQTKEFNQRGKTSGLQNKFTTGSSPFASARDPLGRTNEEINALLDERAKIVQKNIDDQAKLVIKNKEEMDIVRRSLQPRLKGTRLQQEENKLVNEELDRRAELFMLQQKEIKNIANTIRTKKIKEIQNEAKIENEILNIKAKQAQAEMDSIKRSKLQMSINNKRLQIEKRMSNPFTRMGHNIRSRGRGARQAREMAMSNALIGGAFPLLFGQGLGASVGGAAGGGAGGLMGGQFGFALSLVGTALGSQFDRLAQSARELGEALRNPIKNVDLLTQKIGAANTPFGDTVSTLKDLGLEGVAAEAVLERFNKTFNTNRKTITELGEESIQFTNELQKLGTGITLLVAGPLTKFLQIVNDTLGNTTEIGVRRDAGLEARKLAMEKFGIGRGIIGNFRAKREVDMISALADKFFPIKEIDGETFEEYARRIEKEILARKMNEAGLDGQVEKDLQRLIKERRDFELFTLQKQLEIEKQSLTMRSEDLNVLKRRMDLLKIEEKLKVKGLADTKIMTAEQKRAHQFAIDKLEIERQISKELLDQAIIMADPMQAALVDLNKEMEKFNDFRYQAVEFAKVFGGAFQESFKGIIKGTMTVQDAFRNMFNRIADHFLDMAAQMIANQLQRSLLGFIGNAFLGGIGGGGGGAVNLDEMSLYANTGSTVTMADFGGGLASGGMTKGGKSYLVGERGPELFTPGVSGMVTPNHALGGSTNIVVNVDASGSSVQGSEDRGRELGRLISVAVQSELLEQKRPGGLLA